MKREITITQKYLKSILDYDCQTGIFTWKIRKARCVYIGAVAGCRDHRNYIIIGIDKKMYYAHRLAWLYVNGILLDEIDHINLDKEDNRICNLRPADRFDNSHNKGLQKNNTSGFKGVWFEGKKWRSRIKIKNKKINLGSFNTPEEAHAAYCEAAKTLHGEFARYT